MGRGSATAFHPHCVIYNITDTTTLKFAQGVCIEKESEREKKKQNNERINNSEDASQPR